jgi:hypothetical protein
MSYTGMMLRGGVGTATIRQPRRSQSDEGGSAQRPIHKLETTLDPFEALIDPIQADRLIGEVAMQQSYLPLERSDTARHIHLARNQIIELCVHARKLLTHEVKHVMALAHDYPSKP